MEIPVRQISDTKEKPTKKFSISMIHFKVSFLFLLSALLLSCTSSQKPRKVEFPDEPVISVSEKSVPGYQKNWKTMGVRGKVKEIFCTDYKQFVPDSLLPNYRTKENFTFDRKGNLIEESGYLEQQQFSHRYKYAFDKMGNCLKTVSLAEKNDSILFIDQIALDKGGRVMSSIFYQRVPIDQKMRMFEYKLVARKKQNSYELVSDSLVIYREIRETKELFKHVDRYQNGNLVSSILFSEGKFLSETINRYDAQNNLVFRSDSTNSDCSVTTYNYDKENRVTSISLRIDARGVFNEFESTYDQFGNKTKSVTKKKGIIDEHDSFTNAYTYDRQGNWTQCERRKLNGKLISIVKRRVTYY